MHISGQDDEDFPPTNDLEDHGAPHGMSPST